jgi:DNA-binding ferritin-like protein
MPTTAQHSDQIDRNRACISFLQTADPRFYDWEITGMFYIAVHQVERYLYEKSGQHIDNHEIRNKMMGQTTDFKPIWLDYRTLQEMSRDARYNCFPMTPEDVTDASELLASIESHIEGLR